MILKSVSIVIMVLMSQISLALITILTTSSYQEAQFYFKMEYWNTLVIQTSQYAIVNSFEYKQTSFQKTNVTYSAQFVNLVKRIIRDSRDLRLLESVKRDERLSLES